MSGMETLPNKMKKLRACLYCKLVKAEDQFLHSQCDNCQTRIDNNQDLNSLTTTNFSGMISMMDPSHSWTAKWQDLSSLCIGCYAIDVKKDYD